MSKAAQRKKGAYAFGYRVGRYGWPVGTKQFQPGSVQASRAFEAGCRAGMRDRAAAEAVASADRRRSAVSLVGFAVFVGAVASIALAAILKT